MKKFKKKKDLIKMMMKMSLRKLLKKTSTKQALTIKMKKPIGWNYSSWKTKA